MDLDPNRLLDPEPDFIRLLSRLFTVSSKV